MKEATSSWLRLFGDGKISVRVYMRVNIMISLKWRRNFFIYFIMVWPISLSFEGNNRQVN